MKAELFLTILTVVIGLGGGSIAVYMDYLVRKEIRKILKKQGRKAH